MIAKKGILTKCLESDAKLEIPTRNELVEIIKISYNSTPIRIRGKKNIVLYEKYLS